MSNKTNWLTAAQDALRLLLDEIDYTRREISRLEVVGLDPVVRRMLVHHDNLTEAHRVLDAAVGAALDDKVRSAQEMSGAVLSAALAGALQAGDKKDA